MECLFKQDFLETDSLIEIEDSEFKHVKSLRLKDGSYVEISNGKGIVAKTRLTKLKKNSSEFEVVDIYKFRNEFKNRIGLVQPILSDRNRFEFSLEKAVELGITDFYPAIFKFSQKKKLNIDRLIQKAIAAMKQSRRAILPQIHNIIKKNDLESLSKKYERIVLADENGNKISDIKENVDTLFIVGPEGGFDSSEIKHLEGTMKIDKVNLGSTRLRSETAAITLLSVWLNI